MRILLIAATASVAMAGAAHAQPGPRWGTAPHGSMAGAPMPVAHPVPMQAPAARTPVPMAHAQGWHGQPGGWHGGNWHGGDHHSHSRWGWRRGGRWWGGWNAPGGWGAYRRPPIGWTLPGYWISPGFAIGDYGTYGLGAPPPGYTWSRYYDDAVLIDGQGRVRDCVDGVDWDRYPDAYDDGAPDGEPLDYEPYDHDYGADHDAPPYDFGGRGPPPGPGPGYPPPPPAMVQQYGPGCGCGTIVNGWWYPPATTTVITVNSQPVTTTRTYTDYVTTYRTAYKPARVWRHTKLVPRTPTKLVRRTPTKLVPR